MRYPGDLVLTAGTAVTATQGLAAWPFKPFIDFLPGEDGSADFAAENVPINFKF